MRSFLLVAAFVALTFAASSSALASAFDSFVDDDAAAALASSFDGVSFAQTADAKTAATKKKKTSGKSDSVSRFVECNQVELERCHAWKGGKACSRKWCVTQTCKSSALAECMQRGGATRVSCEKQHCTTNKEASVTRYVGCEQAKLEKCQKGGGGKACSRKWCATLLCAKAKLAACEAKSETAACEKAHCVRSERSGGAARRSAKKAIKKDLKAQKKKTTKTKKSGEKKASKGEKKSSSSSSSSSAVSAAAQKQMDCVLAYGMRHNSGRSGGHCFRYVWGYLTASACSGYGAIRRWTDCPRMGNLYARYFADFFNVEKNRKRWKIKKLPAKTPWDCPRGGIVVVAPHSPGTSHDKAGDITIARGDGKFLNDGPNMSYRERSAFPPSKMLGCFVPDI